MDMEPEDRDSAQAAEWLKLSHHDDIFLQPHCDDICFSMGMLARRRHRGILLTAYPLSKYCFDSALRQSAGLRRITERRLAEDGVFAAACGLQAVYLQYVDAGARGELPFDSSQEVHAQTIENDLLNALLGPTIGRSPDSRSWLFCPAGIGGHVDHLAVLRIVLRHLRHLEKYYRIGFFEDLHYASDRYKRQEGVARLHDLLANREIHRCRFPLDEKAQHIKLGLVRLYASQLGPQPQRIMAFAPAIEEPGESLSTPHEAIWLLQPDRHQRPG